MGSDLELSLHTAQLFPKVLSLSCAPKNRVWIRGAPSKDATKSKRLRVVTPGHKHKGRKEAFFQPRHTREPARHMPHGVMVLGSPLTPAQAAAAEAFMSIGRTAHIAVEDLPEEPTPFQGKRDSAITAAKYNKWVVGELNRAIVKDMQRESSELRAMKQRLKEQHLAWATRRRHEIRRQDHGIAGRSATEMVSQQNLAKAMQVKEGMEARRLKQQEERAQWIEHGRRLAFQEKIQRSRSKEAVDANSRRSAELTAMARHDAIDLERHLLHRREEMHHHHRVNTQRVRAGTAPDLIEQSKSWSSSQRRQQARGVASSRDAWKTTRDQEIMSHITKAKANKAAAEASRKKAKDIRAQMELTRRLSVPAKKRVQFHEAGWLRSSPKSAGGANRMPGGTTTSVGKVHARWWMFVS